MKTRDIRDLVHFEEGGARRDTLHESERLWSQVICLDRTQRVGPIGDAASDALCVVLSGRVAAQLDRSRARMGQWESALVLAGSQLTLTNASEDPAVVLIVVAPPPPRA